MPKAQSSIEYASTNHRTGMRSEPWNSISKIASFSIVLTLVASGACLLLLPNFALLFPPFVMATIGWVVLLAGLSGFCRSEYWAVRCELLGCLLQWCFYGFVVSKLITRMCSPTDVAYL